MTAWTAPKTWNKRDILTSGDMNTYVRDNTKHLQERANSLMNVARVTYTSAISEVVAGAWEDIVNGNPTALQLTFTPRSASSLLLFRFVAGLGISAAAEIAFTMRVDGSGNAGYFALPNFSGGQVCYEYVTSLSVASHTIKPMWYCGATRTLTHPSSSLMAMTMMELGPLG